MLNLRMYWQLKVYTWIFLIGFGCWGVLNTNGISFLFLISRAFQFRNRFIVSSVSFFIRSYIFGLDIKYDLCNSRPK